MNSKKKVTELGMTVQQGVSNDDPTYDTQSQPNSLKRSVSVGRQPVEKFATHSTIESLRPTEEEIKNG